MILLQYIVLGSSYLLNSEIWLEFCTLIYFYFLDNIFMAYISHYMLHMCHLVRSQFLTVLVTYIFVYFGNQKNLVVRRMNVPININIKYQLLPKKYYIRETIRKFLSLFPRGPRWNLKSFESLLINSWGNCGVVAQYNNNGLVVNPSCSNNDLVWQIEVRHRNAGNYPVQSALLVQPIKP